MSKTYFLKKKMFLTFILAGIVIPSAFSMNVLNDEIFQRAGEALRDARTAAQTAADARTEATLARATANNARNMINEAVNNAVGTAEQRMQARAAQIENQIDQRVNAAAHNAANGVRDRLNDIVRNAQGHENQARAHADRANMRANDAHGDAVRAQQALNGVQQQINNAFQQLEPQLRQAAINNAVQVEQARQQVLNDGLAARNANELQLHRDREAIRVQNDLQVEQQRAQNEQNLQQQRAQDERQNNIALLQERQRLGIVEQEARIHAEAQAQASIQEANIKWNKIQEMFGSFGDGIYNVTSDPKRMAKVGGAIIATAAGIYIAKHGIPVLINHLVQPRVVSETSRQSWFGWKAPTETININDLTFKPDLQKQLLDLALRVKTAKEFDENLPNALFFGAPGTGKTAFAKALAYWSGLDYALTSGSEFAKITDLNLQNKELRKLIEWGKTSHKGLIIFIDEAESLFANRMLPTTSKDVQDFINTFLALVPEKSQKNVMFIFATNHPFKLDDAITNRVGINVEFTVPEQPERIKILGSYLDKFAQENKEALVQLPAATLKHLPEYAQKLEGLAPRAIKFVAEEMVVRARRNKTNPILSETIAREVLHEAKTTLEKTAQWEAQREQWVAAQLGIAPQSASAAVQSTSIIDRS